MSLRIIIGDLIYLKMETIDRAYFVMILFGIIKYCYGRFSNLISERTINFIMYQRSELMSDPSAAVMNATM